MYWLVLIILKMKSIWRHKQIIIIEKLNIVLLKTIERRYLLVKVGLSEQNQVSTTVKLLA